MTASQATHLIEQFAAQCPLGIWILDSRGIAIFANPKLHKMLQIQSSPSGAVGMNILKLSSFQSLHLEDTRERLLAGESIAETLSLENPSEFDSEIEVGRKEPLVMRIVAYALKSSDQRIEHFVIFLEDITSTQSHHEELREQTRDIQTFMRSKETRKGSLAELKNQADVLREQIRKLGQEPRF